MTHQKNTYFSDFANAEKRALSIKWKLIDQLDKNLLTFEANMLQKQCKVAWADSIEEVHQSIEKILSFSKPEAIVSTSSTLFNELDITKETIHFEGPILNQTIGKEEEGSLVPNYFTKPTEEDLKQGLNDKWVKYLTQKKSLAILAPNYITIDGSAVFNSTDIRNNIALDKAETKIILVPINGIVQSIDDVELFNGLINHYNELQAPATTTIWTPKNTQNVYFLLFDNNRIDSVLSNEYMRPLLYDFQYGNDLTPSTKFSVGKIRFSFKNHLCTEAALYDSILTKNKFLAFKFSPLLYKNTLKPSTIDKMRLSLITKAIQLDKQESILSNKEKWAVYLYKKAMLNRKILDFPSPKLKAKIAQYFIPNAKKNLLPTKAEKSLIQQRKDQLK